MYFAKATVESKRKFKLEKTTAGSNYFQEPDGIPTNNRLNSMKGLKRFAPHKQIFGKMGSTNRKHSIDILPFDLMISTHNKKQSQCQLL